MAEFVQHPAIQAIAEALVHFIWQGAVIGLVAWLAFRFVSSASARYLAGVAALAAMLAAPAVTTVWLARAPARVAPGLSLASSGPDAAVIGVTSAPALPSPDAIAAERTDRAVLLRAAVVALWLVGVAVGLMRLVGGWIVARQLAIRAVEPASAAVQALARHLAARLALGRDIVILQSHRVAVPVMIGWIKPAVVLPVAALAGLTPTQIEAILAHELAHVRRHDFPVNVLQSVTEAVLFFHPAVWWVSARVRAERELCCDDLAVSLCDRVVYATALGDLAALASPRVALAATDGDLLARVRRILRPETVDARARLTPGFVVGLIAALLAPVAIVAAQRPAAADARRVAHAHAEEARRADARSVARADAQERLGIHARHVTLATNEHGALEIQARHVTVASHEHGDARAAHAAHVDPQTSEQERARAAKGAARLLVEIPRHLEGLTHERAQSQAAREQSETARLAELQTATARMVRQRELYDRGLVTEEQLRQAERAVELLRTLGDARQHAEARLDAARAEHARVARLFEQGLITQEQVRAREAALASLARDLQAAERAREQLTSARTADQSTSEQARLRALSDHLARMTETMRAHEAAALDPTAPIRAGDILHITIEGEPDLPLIYRVTADGTIRLPFVGAIKVLALTADEARAAIGRALSDRRLAKADQITLTVLWGGVAR